jgi:hypothetical protein
MRSIKANILGMLAPVLFLACTMLIAPGTVWAIDLYTENFEVDPTANWTMNGGPVDEPGTGNTDGDNRAFFFFDYSTVGIPKAPNSAAGDGTRGMKLQTNLDANSDGIGTSVAVTGMSVSPNGQDFSTAGDYRLSFDLWGNFPGPFPAGSSGTSQLSTFGIETSGTFANYPGAADGYWFAATVDGGSSSDYRVYSQERAVSYQVPVVTPEDEHAAYHAGGRNNTADLYANNFGNIEAPAAQVALYPQQTGATGAGSLGMEWHEVEIARIGSSITWKVDEVLLISLDTTNVAVPPGGGNILFGHSDINAGASADPERFNLLFTLIDNIKVSTITPGPTTNADFNGNMVVDAADFVLWRKNLGATGTGTRATGDANGDTNVNQADYDLWRAAFGTSVGGGVGTAVPEPACGLLSMLAALGASLSRQRRESSTRP